MITRSRFLRFILIPFAAIGTLGAGVAMAGNHFGPHDPGMRHQMLLDHLDAIADELGLTDDQVDQIKTIAEDAHSQAEGLRASHEDLRAEGVALFTADTLDLQAIEAHRQQMLLAANEGTLLLTDTMVAVAEVLTPDQRRALAAKMETFHADGGLPGRMHRRFGGDWHR